MSDAEQTKLSASRIEVMKAAQRFQMLSNHPHLQAEAIADHYSKLAAAAMELRKMVDFRRRSGSSYELDECIDRRAKEFLTWHREDFGIELTWRRHSPDTIDL